MNRTTRTTTTAAALLAYAAARWRAHRIRALPDRFPAALLRAEPVGEQGTLIRPDGTRLRTVSAGDGPPVVLVHGYGSSVLEWNVLFDRLVAGGRRVITYDHRGHERSGVGSDGVGSAQLAGDLQAVLEDADVRDGVLVGHSMGGFVAIRTLLDHPRTAARLRGLVLAATFAGAVYDGAPLNRLQIPLLRAGIMQRIMGTSTGGTLFGASVSGDEPSSAEIDAHLEVFLRQDHRVIAPMLVAFGAEDRYPRLGEIDVPTVVVAGGADGTAPPVHAERLAAGIPGARLERIPGRGHLLNWEAVDELVAVVRSFPRRT